MGSVSVVVPFHSNANYLMTALASLELALEGDDEIVVVVNNKRVDENLGLDAFPRVRPLYFAENLGFSRACNIGARTAQHDLLFFCDSDTLTLTPDSLRVHRCELEQNGVGATSSMLLSPATGTVGDYGLGWSGYNVFHPFRSALLDDPRLQAARRVQMACSAHMMTPRAAFTRLGGFDEELRYHYQDTDYCLRLKDLGLSVRVTPHSRAFHRGDSADVNRAAFKMDDRALFVSKNVARLSPDYVDYLRESLALTPPSRSHAFYNAAILSTMFDPGPTLDAVGEHVEIRRHVEHHLKDRDAPSLDLFAHLGRTGASLPEPYLFIVDTIQCLRFNAIWKHIRGERGDIAVDRHGEVRAMSGLVH